MCRKQKMFIRILFFCFIVGFWGTRASANDEIPENLPEITRWECGGGYDSEGSRIIGVWAYDTTGQAGKYVLFDENGMVLKKADNWENRDQAEEYYTPTEQDSGAIALRSEAFAGFDGEISVTIESENGVSKKFVLSADNLYEMNVPAPGGVYRIQNAEAADSQYVYTVEYPKEWFQMEKNGLLFLRIKIVGLKIGEVQTDDPKDAGDEESFLESQTEHIKIEENGGEKEPMKEKMDISKEALSKGNAENKYRNPKNILIGVILMLILSAGILIRNQRNTYQ